MPKLLLISVFTIVFGQDQLSDNRSDNAGIRIIVTKKGLDYANGISGEILDELLQKLTVPHFRHTIRKGFVEATSLRIANFTHPNYSYQLIPDSKIQWDMHGAGIVLHGNYKAEKKKLIKLKKSGNFEANATDVSLSLTVTFEKTPDGKPTVTDVQCTSKIGELDLKIKGGIIGWVINLFNEHISDRLKPELEKQMCSKTNDYIRLNFNEKLQSFPTTVRVSPELVLDMGLTKAPVILNDVLESRHSGEISFAGSGGTPFLAHDLQVQPNYNKMINVFISDYVVNSFFYHAHHNGVLEHVLQNRSYLDLRCPGRDCLGVLMPYILEKYPDSVKAIVNIKSLQPPTVEFLKKKASLDLFGLMQIHLVQPDARIVMGVNATLNISANVKVRIIGMNITSVMDISRFKFQTPDAKLLESLSGMAFIVKSMISMYANRQLSRGIPLQLTRGIAYVDPVIQLVPKTLQLYSDVNYSIEGGD